MKTVDGTVIRLSTVASITPSVRNTKSAGWFNKQPSVLLIITKQGSANVIDTVDRIFALLPELRQWVPAGLDISVLTDRTQTIRASVHDMQLTLAATAVLVMMVVFLFLRRTAATIAAGITVPLSLAGTCAAMWLAGFSIDNLSLMALAVSIGFVVDDAIVMIENVFRNLEMGHSPLRATLLGAKQIGFTVVSISVSLIAAFIPLLFMGGIVGRLFREFSVTLAFAIGVSTVVSLSVTPMICAYFVHSPPSKDATWLDRMVEGVLSRMIRFYDRSLGYVLDHRALALMVFVATIALTVGLYIKAPKGYFPQDDTGLIFGGTQASTDISFEAMETLQLKAMDIVLADPAVAGLGSSVGASGFNASVNNGRLFISLKPLAERNGVSTATVVNRLRGKLSQIPGIRVFMVPAQDLRVGGRQSNSQYQFTLWSSDIDQLQAWVPRVVDRVKQLASVTDLTTDREQGGLQANVVIDRKAAARLGVASRTSTTRSTTRSRSGRYRRSTGRATSIASFWKWTANTSATRPISRRSMFRATAMRRCHYRRWPRSSAALRRWSSTIRASSRRRPSPTISRRTTRSTKRRPISRRRWPRCISPILSMPTSPATCRPSSRR